MQEQSRLYLGGTWTEPESSARLTLTSPHDRSPLGSVAAAGPGDVDRAVQAARAAFDHGDWPRRAPSDRAAVVRDLAARHRERRKDFARLITAEMGSPRSFAGFAQATLPNLLLDALAAQADRFPWEEARPGYFGADVLVRHEPVGVVGAIVPWNMPQFLLVGKLAPALLAGCSIVIKPSPETSLDALLLAELLDEVDIPAGVVSILPGGVEVGRALVRHPGVDKVAFTGSSTVGRDIAEACGRDLRRVSLELGGKSAAIVLDDADPAAVAAGVKVAGLMNSGQACVAQTRILVPAARQAEFVDALAAMVDELAVGDPSDPATEIGPLVSDRQQARVRGYIQAGETDGARLVTGGANLPAHLEGGSYVRPTLFADVDNRSAIAREEIFGPVLSVIAYEGDDAAAVALANDSDYGLSGSVWTTDGARGLAVARTVRTGSFGINEPYSMDPAAPFGGIKASGIGRELGREGLASYLDVKSISTAAPTADPPG